MKGLPLSLSQNAEAGNETRSPIHTPGLVLGGIVERTVLVAGQIETHEYLCLTITLDHGIIDGAPAARFAQRLCDLIEREDDLFRNPGKLGLQGEPGRV